MEFYYVVFILGLILHIIYRTALLPFRRDNQSGN